MCNGADRRQVAVASVDAPLMLCGYLSGGRQRDDISTADG
jgi:hypothetical protein